MTDYISRADALMELNGVCSNWQDDTKVAEIIHALPSAELPKGDLISRADAIEAVRHSKSYVIFKEAIVVDKNEVMEKLKALPSADAVHIHNDGTLEVKIPNAQKVGRVLVKDVDSHIGGGLFYQDDAVQGEWIHDGQNFKGGLDWCHCSECGYKTSMNGLSVYRYCPNCGAIMKGGDE